MFVTINKCSCNCVSYTNYALRHCKRHWWDWYKIIAKTSTTGAVFVIHRVHMGTSLVYRCWPVVGIFVSLLLVAACEEPMVQEPACTLDTDGAEQTKAIDRRSSDGIVLYAYNLYC